MADPISIIGLLGTAGTLTKTILDYASSVKDGPKELENLSRELASLRNVFERLGELVQGEDGREHFKEVSTLYDAAADLVLTLDDLRKKIENLSTAKGLRKICNRLKWPIDGPDTHKLFQTFQRHTQIFHFALTVEGVSMLSQASGKVSEVLRVSQRISQTQSETLQAIVALPDHTEIMAKLKQLQSYLNDNQKQRWDEDQNFLRQLTPLDFTAMQKESYSKRCANTGQWLLESPEFQTWLKSEGDQCSVLWCPGNPGAGKTVITSVAVNHITEITDGQKTAIVYIYCDYANALTFSVVNLLGSMVRQLIVQTSGAGMITELKTFLKQTAKNRNLTEEDLSSWTEKISRSFDVVYTFVDALDECPEIGRDSLLTRLRQFSVRNMRVFLTSRFNVNVTFKIPHAKRARISATRHDISAYVESKIHESSRLTQFTTKDPELRRHIIDSISSRADGMFLLAGLQTRSLGNHTSAKKVRLALERLPIDIFAMYDLNIERIRDQSKEEAELGLKALSMMFAATRTLQVDELLHALAVQPEDTDFDFEDLVDLETLLSVTAGLVVTYQDDTYHKKRHGKKCFRLVHYTLHEYLKANHERLFPDSRLYMARVCLMYLSLDEFTSGKCATEDLMDKRRRNYCFLDYAATEWVHHLRRVQMELMNQSLVFVHDSKKTSAWLQCLGYNLGYIQDYEYRLTSGQDHHLDPIFLAAHYHLSDLFENLITSRDINTRNSHGETPLIRAVDVIPREKFGPPPFLDFRDEETWQKGNDPPFIRSMDCEQHAMVQLILDHNADIEAKDSLGLTAAVEAVGNDNRAMLSLLLDRGADVNITELRKSPPLLYGSDSLLHFAARDERRVDIVQFLLDRGADVNTRNMHGRSPLHFAATHSTSTILDCLVDHGALLDIADEDGVTPLMSAVQEHRLETLTSLIKRGARLDIMDSTGKSPLHLAIPTLEPARPYVVEIVMRLQRVDVIDKKGRTPLHHAYFESAQERGPALADGERQLMGANIADVIRQLIKGGASETIADADGRIPKDYSDWSGWDLHDQWSKDYWNLAHPHDDWSLHPSKRLPHIPW